MNQDFTGHGTSVLGEVLAVDNKKGDVGIAPHATAHVVSQWRTASNYNTAAAILSAEQAMSAGDVLLLEAQTSYAGTSNLPVEVETAVFDAIRHAVDAGIIVVEAAGIQVFPPKVDAWSPGWTAPRRRTIDHPAR